MLRACSQAVRGVQRIEEACSEQTTILCDVTWPLGKISCCELQIFLQLVPRIACKHRIATAGFAPAKVDEIRTKLEIAVI